MEKHLLFKQVLKNYVGCTVYRLDTFHPMKLRGVLNLDERGYECINFEGAWWTWDNTIKHCKLFLKPIMSFSIGDGKIISNLTDISIDTLIKLTKNNFKTIEGIPINKIALICDYMREMEYDVDGLIELGYAITQEQFEELFQKARQEYKLKKYDRERPEFL